jgi:hypothetical protein
MTALPKINQLVPVDGTHSSSGQPEARGGTHDEGGQGDLPVAPWTRSTRGRSAFVSLPPRELSTGASLIGSLYAEVLARKLRKDEGRS